MKNTVYIYAAKTNKNTTQKWRKMEKNGVYARCRKQKITLTDCKKHFKIIHDCKA